MSRWPVLLLCAALLAGAAARGADTAPSSGAASAIFAGGCFWCLEADFEKLPGVLAVESGYTGGHAVDPGYEEVSRGDTGHAEAVRVHYDPSRLGYAQLLDYFWRHIDPTVKDRQFCDAGSQYRSAIFPATAEELAMAEASRDALRASGRFARVETEITMASTFYPAEQYHQDYYRKNPLRYAYYRRACGRDARIEELWGERR